MDRPLRRRLRRWLSVRVHHCSLRQACPFSADARGRRDLVIADCVMRAPPTPTICRSDRVPPSCTGFAQLLLRPERGEEVMMKCPPNLRSERSWRRLPKPERSRRDYAKDKLRKLLGHQMTGICFSLKRPTSQFAKRRRERAGRVACPFHPLQRGAIGIRLRAGVKLMKASD